MSIGEDVAGNVPINSAESNEIYNGGGVTVGATRMPNARAYVPRHSWVSHSVARTTHHRRIDHRPRSATPSPVTLLSYRLVLFHIWRGAKLSLIGDKKRLKKNIDLCITRYERITDQLSNMIALQISCFAFVTTSVVKCCHLTIWDMRFAILFTCSRIVAASYIKVSDVSFIFRYMFTYMWNLICIIKLCTCLIIFISTRVYSYLILPLQR